VTKKGGDSLVLMPSFIFACRDNVTFLVSHKEHFDFMPVQFHGDANSSNGPDDALNEKTSGTGINIPVCWRGDAETQDNHGCIFYEFFL